MNNKEYLSEEQYQKTKKKLKSIGILLMCIGLPLAIIGFVTTFIMHSGTNLFFLMFLGMPMIFIGAFLILTSHAREIAAFSLQQKMPIAQEGIEKMAPTVGKAGASIAKEMTPVYGEIAKEVTKGIKEGMKEEEK